MQIAKFSAAKRQPAAGDKNDDHEVKSLKLFAPCGRPYSLNKPKLNFNILDEPDRYELDLHVYK